MNKKLVTLLLLLLLITLGVIGSIYLLYGGNDYIPKPKIIRSAIKTVTPYYIQLDFNEHNKKIIFADASWNELKVMEGEAHVNVDRRDFPDEFTIDIINLKGDYRLKYKDINFIINSQGITINNKLMDDSSVVIDNKGNFGWGHWINYWEIPTY